MVKKWLEKFTALSAKKQAATYFMIALVSYSFYGSIRVLIVNPIIQYFHEDTHHGS
jgi:hypothetical protein